MAAGRDERAWVRGAQRGSAPALEALFRLHWPRAFRAAFLVVHDAAAAEDIAQESFLAAVRALDRFDRRRPFGPWLHRIVVNRAIDWSRARQLRGETELSDSLSEPERAPSFDGTVLASLAALPPEHRAVIVLRHLLEYTPGEIAELLGLPRGTVNSRLRRGLDSLRRACVKRELEHVEIPGEHEARERAQAVVLAGFAEREPAPRGRSWNPVLVLAFLLALVAGLLSPPGQAVLGELREVVGVEQAQPALFSLPAKGRVLVVSGTSAWSVSADGSTRLLGPYRDAAWSPFGRFVVGATPLQLTAFEPDGDKRWSLARPDVRLPAWGGTRIDTRIAYLSGTTLRVVAGDGTGDRIVARGAAQVAPVWLPRAPHALTYATGDGKLRTVSLQTGRELWRTARGNRVERLEWSTDGRRLLVLRAGNVEIRDRTGSLFTGIRPASGAVSAATFRPGSHAVAYVTVLGGRSRVSLLDEPSRTLLTVVGRIAQLAWSPDGSTILVPWGDADQWLFIPRRTGKLRAVDGISEQFDGFPRSVSWCCP